MRTKISMKRGGESKKCEGVCFSQTDFFKIYKCFAFWTFVKNKEKLHSKSEKPTIFDDTQWSRIKHNEWHNHTTSNEKHLKLGYFSSQILQFCTFSLFEQLNPFLGSKFPIIVISSHSYLRFNIGSFVSRTWSLISNKVLSIYNLDLFPPPWTRL